MQGALDAYVGCAMVLQSCERLESLLSFFIALSAERGDGHVARLWLANRHKYRSQRTERKVGDVGELAIAENIERRRLRFGYALVADVERRAARVGQARRNPQGFAKLRRAVGLL